MGLFGRSTDRSPKDQCREWTSKLRKQGYVLDRQVRALENAEFNIKQECKKAAKKGDKDVCLIMAKELIRSRKAKNRLHAAKAQLNSISMVIKEQMATVKMAGSLQRSTEVMRNMQNLVKVTDIASTMQELSQEMMKTGIIGEMMDEAIEEAIDEEEIDEEAQQEVDKILSELKVDKLSNAPAKTKAPTSEPIQREAVSSKAKDPTPEHDADDDMQKMQKRLEMLRS